MLFSAIEGAMAKDVSAAECREASSDMSAAECREASSDAS